MQFLEACSEIKPVWLRSWYSQKQKHTLFISIFICVLLFITAYLMNVWGWCLGGILYWKLHALCVFVKRGHIFSYIKCQTPGNMADKNNRQQNIFQRSAVDKAVYSTQVVTGPVFKGFKYSNRLFNLLCPDHFGSKVTPQSYLGECTDVIHMLNSGQLTLYGDCSISNVHKG